jgi:ABC-type transport system involved in multi-copper enzyme maturation permease subunit
MANMIQIIANRKNCRRSSPGAVLVGLLIFLIFGIMFFLFFNPSWFFGFNFSIVFWIGGCIIFFAIILAAGAVTMSKPHNNSRNGNMYRKQIPFEKPIVHINPYKASAFKSPTKDVHDKEVNVEVVVNYCQYCGAKKDLNAVFCHMCGTKF